MAPVSKRLGAWSRSRAEFVFTGAARRLGRQPRLAKVVLRLPRLLPEGRVRSYFYRSFSWPLAKRLRAQTEVSVVGGSTILVRTDDMVGRVLAISGVWEPNVTAVFERYLSPGDVCFDIGAHVGYYTLLASKLVGRDGHVYAFEPSPSNYRALCANLSRNRVANVTALEVAVGQPAGTALLHEGTVWNSGGATLRTLQPRRNGTERREVTVDVRPIASSIPEEDFPRIRAIKIDVEGSELEVLRSLAPVFDRGERLAVFLEFNPEWIDDPSAAEYLEGLCHAQRFKLYRLRNDTLEDLFPRRLEGPEHLESIPGYQCDLLLTR